MRLKDFLQPPTMISHGISTVVHKSSKYLPKNLHRNMLFRKNPGDLAPFLLELYSIKVYAALQHLQMEKTAADNIKCKIGSLYASCIKAFLLRTKGD